MSLPLHPHRAQSRLKPGEPLRRGYMNYYAVPGHIECVLRFRSFVIRRRFRTLRRRGDRRRISRARFGPLAESWLPRARIVHQYPQQRFYVLHPR